jgi:uncharacterized protein YegP (UPF0339 family)
MATATHKARTATRGKGDPLPASASISMEFVIFEDNGGAYRWSLLGGDRASLAQSPRFASYGDAERAAQLVLEGAGTARLDRAAGG